MSNHDLSDAQSVSLERCDLRLVGVGILDDLSNNSRIDERHNATESGSGWERGIRANGWDVNNKRVEVLLGSDKPSCSGNSCIAGSKFSNDSISLG